MDAALCSGCHTGDAVGDDCASCHNYHLGDFLPAQRTEHSRTHASPTHPLETYSQLLISRKADQ